MCEETNNRKEKTDNYYYDIKDMENLKAIIEGNDFYRRLYFWVTYYPCRHKDMERSYCCNKATKNKVNIQFGKKENNGLYGLTEKMVSIEAYYDYVELTYEGKQFSTPYSFSVEPKDKDISEIERRIISALDAWACYYKN